MNSSFSFSRLGKLISKQFFENTKFYLYAVLALAGLLALVFAFWLKTAGNHYSEETTWMVFVFGLYISGSIFASMSFNMLGQKDKGIYWLSIPATHFEKLLCTIFFTTVLFTIAYCVCFFAIKSIAVMALRQMIEENPQQYSYKEMTDYTKGFGEVLPYFICGFFAVQALYLLGSVYFSKYSFVVTTVVAALLFFAFGYYLNKVSGMFDRPMYFELIQVEKHEPGNKEHYFIYSLPPLVSNFLRYAVQYGWAPIFWFVTWYRLREKEI